MNEVFLLLSGLLFLLLGMFGQEVEIKRAHLNSNSIGVYLAQALITIGTIVITVIISYWCSQ